MRSTYRWNGMKVVPTTLQSGERGYISEPTDEGARWFFYSLTGDLPAPNQSVCAAFVDDNGNRGTPFTLPEWRVR